MASQSVTLLYNGTQANRTLRVGGTLVASNWAEFTTIYTVPSGKRLIIKARQDVAASNDGTDQVTLAVTTAVAVAMTLVLSAGTILRTSGASPFVATGFLEDDL